MADITNMMGMGDPLEPLPCVGCGWCCLRDPCNVSHQLYGYQKKCPALFWDEADNRYKCKLAMDPELGAEYRKALFVGEGCCARHNNWRNDVKKRD